MGWLILLGVFIVFVMVVPREFNPKSQKELNEAALKKFGDTKEERFKNIISFFDKKMGQIECDIDYKSQYSRIRKTFERNLKTLDQSERDALVTAYLLYNEDFMPDNNFYLSRFALLYGEGSGQPVSSNNPKTGQKDIDKLPEYARGQRSLPWLTDQLGLNSKAISSTIYRTLEDSLEEKPDNETLRYLNKRLNGLHVWSTQDDLTGSIYTTDITKGYRLGTLIENGVGFEETDIPVNYDEGRPVMAYAPTGEGKTQCFALPNLLTWRGACIVLDVKGELYEKTSQWRSLNIGPVYRFNPLNPDDSLRFNPLNEIRDNPNFVFGDARKIAWHMIAPQNTKEPYWEDSAREFLAAAMAVVAEGAPVGQRDFNKVLDIITGHNIAQFVAQLKQHSDAGMCRTGMSLGSNMNPKELNSILSTARTALSGWDSNNIQKVTSGQNDWSTAAFCSGNQGDRPPTLYIEINPAEIEQYQSLIRTVLGMHFDRLYEVQPAHDEKRDVLFILDEMPTLNYMKPIEKAFSTGRSYGISLFAIAQSKKQLDVAYPEAEAMMTNAAVRLYMSPKMADGTAKEVSDELGVKSTQGEMTEPNVRPEVLAQGEYDDKIIALGSNSKPILLKRQYAHADEDLKSKMGELPTYAMKAKANQGHYHSENKIYQKDLQVIKGQKTKENLKKIKAIANPINPLRRRPKDNK